MAQAIELRAFILHRRPYRETSYLVDCFSQEHGLVSFVAKGVRRAKSPNKSALQPFQLLDLQLYGRHELKNLKRAEIKHKPIALTAGALFSAMYLNELLTRLLPKELPVEDLFLHYQQTLEWLGHHSELEIGLRQFELKLLDELGYGFDFSCEWQNQQPLEGELYYTFMPEQGFQLLPQSVSHKHCFRGADLLDIASGNWHKNSLLAAKKLSRLAINPLLGNKPLKSRELFLKQN